MESSQLKRICVVGLSFLCLSPIEFFSNKLFEKGNTNSSILAMDDIMYEEILLSNNYEIFNPNIKTTSEELKEISKESSKSTDEKNKGKEISDNEENNLESENNSEKFNNTVVDNKETVESSKPVTNVVEKPVSTNNQTANVTSKPVTNSGSVKSEAKPTDTDLASNLVNYALQFVGNPYRYGGTDLYNGVDCSGFTMKIYQNFGYSLPHNASSQSSYGSYVSLDNLQKGDLVFYGYGGSITHVAIYIGNGQIVHAATSDTGILVANLRIMPIITARRIINN